MENSLVWAAIFGGGAFGVVIALLIAAERELRRFRGLANSGRLAAVPPATPQRQDGEGREKNGRPSEWEAERSHLFAQIEELKEENKAKQDRILQLKGAHDEERESANGRLPELESKIAGLEDENSQLKAQVAQLQSDSEAKDQKIQKGNSSQQRVLELERNLSDLEGKKSQLAAELGELKREAAARQDRIHWLERAQERLPEMERRAMDLLNGLRTMLRGGEGDVSRLSEASPDK